MSSKKDMIPADIASAVLTRRPDLLVPMKQRAREGKLTAEEQVALIVVLGEMIEIADADHKRASLAGLRITEVEFSLKQLREKLGEANHNIERIGRYSVPEENTK